MAKQACVYILASRQRRTLYIGVTSDPIKRIWEHKVDIVQSFTRKYSVHTLVYYELHEDMMSAIQREKQIKKWNRTWKIRMIEEAHPEWNDLYDGLV